VAEKVAREVVGAYNIAARRAIGANILATGAAVYGTLGIPSPDTVWASATLGYVDRAARLPDGRLPKVVLEAALTGARLAKGTTNNPVIPGTLNYNTGNSLVDRIVAAHVHLMGVAPTAADILKPKSCKTPAKETRKMNGASRADAEWDEYVEKSAANGAALYVICPPPSQNTYVQKRRYGQFPESRFRLLIQMRTYSHCLRNHSGKRDGIPLNERVCLQCDTEEVESESHHIWRCEPGEPARKKLLETLGGIYPNVEQELSAMPCDERRTLMLLWTLPDGGYEGKVASAMKSDGAARVAATWAILNYLHATHVQHPGLKKYYQPWA